jgi:membrane protein YdbS with pleckstrin-like domain
MSKDETTTGHIGTKFLAMFFGMILAMVYALLQFFTHPTLTVDVLYNIALVTVFFVIIWSLILFLAELLWRYAHKYSEKFPSTQTLPMKFWKLKILTLIPF